MRSDLVRAALTPSKAGLKSGLLWRLARQAFELACVTNLDAAPGEALDHTRGLQSVQLAAHGFQAQAEVVGYFGARQRQLDPERRLRGARTRGVRRQPVRNQDQQGGDPF